MLVHFVAMLAYVGLCWPILRAMWAHLVAMLAYVGLMVTHVEPKEPKNGNSKKHCKTQDILMVGGLSWGYVGPSWGYVGLSSGQCGPILGLCWPILGLCWPILGLGWPILGLCWPILTLCWPILRLRWPILRPMLAHVDPSRATRAEKVQKTGRAQNTVKRGTFWRYREVGGWGGGPSLLRRGENCRTARTRLGGPWPDLSAYARQPARGPTMLAHLVAMPAYVDLSCGKCGPSLS